MTKQEKKDWIAHIFAKSKQYADNEYLTSNVAFMLDRSDGRIEDYVAQHHGRWIHRGRVWAFLLPNGLMYGVLNVSENILGVRARRAIIDSEIDSEDLRTRVLPCCIGYCGQVEII